MIRFDVLEIQEISENSRYMFRQNTELSRSQNNFNFENYNRNLTLTNPNYYSSPHNYYAHTNSRQYITSQSNLSPSSI